MREALTGAGSCVARRAKRAAKASWRNTRSRRLSPPEDRWRPPPARGSWWSPKMRCMCGYMPESHLPAEVRGFRHQKDGGRKKAPHLFFLASSEKDARNMFFCCAPPTHCDLTRRFVSCRRRHLLRSAGGTYRIPGQVCLLMYSLVLTCVVCLEIEESSITCTWRQTKLVPFCKTPGFPHRIRLPSTTYIYIYDPGA